jgi:DNA-binding SARP family transcriptional activator
MYLRTLGGLTVESAASDGSVPSLGPRRLALLAVLAAAGPRGITREKILGILWSESDEEQARHSLSQTLYLLRRDAPSFLITGTTQLRLEPPESSDIAQFQAALDAGQFERAAALYAGPFLEGFYLGGAPQFEEWVETTRARLQFAALKALESLARRAVDAGAFVEAAGWWRRLGDIDPFNAMYAAGRIRALIANGELSGALHFAAEYESCVRRELDVSPDPVIAELVAEIRSRPDTTPMVVATRVTPPVTTWAHAAGPTATSAIRRYLLPAAAILTLVTAGVAWRLNAARPPSDTAPPLIAIGSIQSRDTASLEPVLRDMLATNLARVRGIHVVSNSRLLELLAPSSGETTAGTSDAARRAGANEIIEGDLGKDGVNLVLALRRVALRSGLVLQGYSVRAPDLYALTDSATVAIAGDFKLDPPADALATVRTHSAIAYALYEQGLRSYYKGDFPATVRLMSAALERDSTFAMAAAYAWFVSRASLRHEDADRLLPLVKRLATRATERERLWINGMVAYLGAPLTEFMQIARTMTERFPDDPDGQILLGHALGAAGDWAASIAAYNRAIAIDSAAGAVRGPLCRVCVAAYHLSSSYAWWDSAAATERTAHRLNALRSGEEGERSILIEALLRQGRRAEAEAVISRENKLSPIYRNYQSNLDRDLIRAGRLDELETRLVSELRSAAPDARGEAPWLLGFALRNQGRLREARDLAAKGILPRYAVRLQSHQDQILLAMALESDEPRRSAGIFLDMVAADESGGQIPGLKERGMAWHMTLAATALATAGDTAAVRALADSVQRLGARSSYGRDYRLHHFLRGLLFQRQNRHADAVDAFRRSLFSTTDGYTRTNLEMARSLMILRRYGEAIAILQPALRGGVDGGNTYVTHTELHEAVAHAFHAAGQQDSAAVHYAAVERAWRSADPEFAERYRIARARSDLAN